MKATAKVQEFSNKINEEKSARRDAYGNHESLGRTIQ